MNFGSGLTKFDLDDGSGTIEKSCPFGSSNPGGTVRFECLPSGMWNLSAQTCYDCPELREKFTFVKGETRDVILPPAAHGQLSHEVCAFLDGEHHHHYQRGRISFKCMEGRWHHVNTTCSDTKCRSGSVTLNFHGSLGRVHLQVPASNYLARLKCPEKAPNPHGHIELKCAGTGDEVGTYSFVGQTCQHCNPTSLTLTLDEVHKRNISLPAASLHEEEERSCTFDDGGKIYAFGKVTYKCLEDGWKLWNRTCRDWVCPDQTAVMKMQYIVDGEVMTGQSRIRLKAGMPGTHTFPCPEGSLDPDGTLTFDCLEDRTWRINTISCGNGVQVHKAAASDIHGDALGI